MKGHILIINKHDGQSVKWKAWDLITGKGPEIIGGDPDGKCKYDREYKAKLDGRVQAYRSPDFYYPDRY